MLEATALPTEPQPKSLALQFQLNGLRWKSFPAAAVLFQTKAYLNLFDVDTNDEKTFLEIPLAASASKIIRHFKITELKFFVD